MEIIASIISNRQNENYTNFTQSITQTPARFYVTGIFKRL